MTRFSACLITFNEEENLSAALESVDFADEIVVIDSHSTDSTREIATAFRGRSRTGETVIPRVVERDWPSHVEQKNFAIDAATHDWVLCLDADERLSPQLRDEVTQRLGDSPPRGAGYTMPRRTFYLGRWIGTSGWYPDRKLRLFDRRTGRWSGINPHDHVRVTGSVLPLRGDLQHYSYKDMADHVRTIDSFTDIAGREKLARGGRWPVFSMLTHPPMKFLKMYLLQRGFREGVAGVVLAGLGAFYVFLKYAKLWELRSRQWKEDAIESSPPRLEP